MLGFNKGVYRGVGQAGVTPPPGNSEFSHFSNLKLKSEEEEENLGLEIIFLDIKLR